jgi:hypothetical protein
MRSGRQPKEQDFYGEKVNTIVEEGDPEEKVDEYMHSMLDEDQANTVDLYYQQSLSFLSCSMLRNLPWTK